MNILIADDNIDLLELIRGLISPQHSVVCVSDGAQALKYLRLNKTDFLITDYRMPKPDGVDLVKRVSEEKLLVMSILLISSDLPEDKVLEALKALSEGRFQFFSAEKNTDGFNFIKKI